MNPTDAIRLMVKSYPGGVESLAVLCGKAPDTLRHEIGGKDARYKLGVIDACVISEACIRINSPHCHAYAHAVAETCGGFVQLPVRDMAGPHELRSDFAKVVEEAADVLTSGISGLSDDHLSDNEYRHTTQQLHELREAIGRAQQHLDGVYQAGKRG